MPLSRELIANKYQQLGHTMGWRFLSCPEKNIDTASIALVTINPGGACFEEPKWSVEEGSAYRVEPWKGCDPGKETLQQQVIRMFQIMDVMPDKVLSGYLVPFRSQDWNKLRKKSESIQFGIDLWREVFKRANPRTVLAFGKGITPFMIKLLCATFHANHCAHWGQQTIDVYRFGSNQRLVVLPHLSRFRLFSRPQSESAFHDAIKP